MSRQIDITVGVRAALEEIDRLRAVNAELAGALLECRRVLGIQADFVPFGKAVTLAPIIEAALAKAGVA